MILFQPGHFLSKTFLAVMVATLENVALSIIGVSSLTGKAQLIADFGQVGL